MKMSDRTPIQHLELWRFEAREAQRDAWDEKAEHENDLRQESRECDEREASGYWDNCPYDGEDIEEWQRRSEEDQ